MADLRCSHLYVSLGSARRRANDLSDELYNDPQAREMLAIM